MRSRPEEQRAEQGREVIYRLLLPGKAEPEEFHSESALMPHGLSLRLTMKGAPLEGKNPDFLRFFVGQRELPPSTDLRQFATPAFVIRVQR